MKPGRTTANHFDAVSASRWGKYRPNLLRRRLPAAFARAPRALPALAAGAGMALLALLPGPAAGALPLPDPAAMRVPAELAPKRPARAAPAMALAAVSSSTAGTAARSEPGTGRRPNPDRGLALRLPAFDSPGPVAKGEARPGRPGPADLAGLVSRLDGRHDSPPLPVEAAAAPKPVVPASPGASRPGAPSGSAAVSSPPPSPARGSRRPPAADADPRAAGRTPARRSGTAPAPPSVSPDPCDPPPRRPGVLAPKPGEGCGPAVAAVPRGGGAPADADDGAATAVSPAPSRGPGRAAASEAAAEVTRRLAVPAPSSEPGRDAAPAAPPAAAPRRADPSAFASASEPAASFPTASEPAPPSSTRAGAVASAPAPAADLILEAGEGRRIPLDGDATTVLVASPQVADVQLPLPNVLYVVAKSIGRTSVAVFRGGELLEELSVSVVLNLDPLHRLLSGEPGLAGVRVRRLPRGLVLTGEVASPAAAERALRLASNSLPEGARIENDLRITGLQQVNLEVQIAEVSRAVTEVLGVNWEAFRQTSGETFGFRIGRAFRNQDGLLLPLVSAGGNLASSFHFRGVDPGARFDAMIDALATAGLANVLARPNVTAVSGESASFFSGGEYPLPSGVEDGVIVFEPRQVGVVLDFVPTVVDSGRIVLTVRPEVSERSLNESVEIAQGINYPVINVRRAETTVEVGDGESIVIAGLFRNTSSTVESGVPGLKDVPALGLLFGRTATQAGELELIVIVTARLVHPNPAPADAGDPPVVRRVSGYHF